jgi:sugar lactone lactonase YvrE
MKPFEDYYEILQISPSAEPEVIEAAYKKLARKYHPDVNKSPSSADKMKKINMAYVVLGDPIQREQYHSEWLQERYNQKVAAGTVQVKPYVSSTNQKKARRVITWVLGIIVLVILVFGLIRFMSSQSNTTTTATPNKQPNNGVETTQISKPSTTSNTPPDFIFKWGSGGKGDGQFAFPEGIAMDSASNIYVADTNNCRVQKFSKDGHFLLKWGSTGYGNGQFQYPIDIAVDKLGNLYVLDCCQSALLDNPSGKVQKFDNSGHFLLSWGSTGKGDGQFDAPSGIAVDSEGVIYVADSLNDRIQKFDSAGRFIAKWGPKNEGTWDFSYPTDIAFDSVGNIYIADSGNDKIQKFDKNGRFITKWGIHGTADGQFDEPRRIAIDRLNNIYVVDSNNGRIQKFDDNGKFLTKWGTWGESDGLFSLPAGICIDREGKIYISDQNADRIQVFGLSSDNTTY